jgi:hypothetical protein
MRTMTATLCFSMFALGVATPGWSQERVGVVTAAIGPVTAARTWTAPEPLKFKDAVFRHDRVTTGDDAIARILLGGKVVVTARERSIDLTSGRIAVAVDKTRKKPNDRVDVRAPNVIAGVRGTVLVVEAQGTTSTVTVLRGLVDVIRRDPQTGAPVGMVTSVAARQTVSVRNNVLPSRPDAVTRARAEQLSQEFTPPIKPVAATTTMPVQAELGRAAALADQLLGSSGALATGSATTRAVAVSMSISMTAGPTTTLSSTTSMLTLTSSMLTTPTLRVGGTLITTTDLLRTTTNTVTKDVLSPLLK